MFRKCRACHNVGATAKNKVGSLLHGLMGCQAGAIDGFNYSEANKAAGANGLVWGLVWGLLWTEEVMLTYLAWLRCGMPDPSQVECRLRMQPSRQRCSCAWHRERSCVDL